MYRFVTSVKRHGDSVYPSSTEKASDPVACATVIGPVTHGPMGLKLPELSPFHEPVTTALFADRVTWLAAFTSNPT